MAALGSLVVQLGLNYAQFTGGADAAEQRALQMAKRVQDSMDRVKATAGAAVGAFVGAVTAGAIIQGFRQTIDELDRVSDAADKIGVSAQNLAELGYAAKMSGTDAESLESSMGKLSVKVAEAVGGGKEAVKTFESIGIKLKDAEGKVRSSEEVFGDLADFFQVLPDGVTKTALAVDIFGKSGKEMVPMLSRGREGIAELREEFVRLSGGSQEAARALAGELNDQLDKLAVVSQGAYAQVATQLLPAINAVAGEFTGAGREVSTMSGELTAAGAAGAGLATFFEAMVVLGANVVYVFKGIGREIGGVAAQMSAFDIGFAELLNPAAMAAKLATGLAGSAGAQAANIRKEMLADAEQARADLDAFEKRILGARQNAAAPKPAEDDGEAKRMANRAASAAAEEKARKALAATGAAASKTESEYAKLTTRIGERIQLAEIELKAGRTLTDQEKFAAKVASDMDGAKKSLTTAERAHIAALLARSEAAQLALDIDRSLIKSAQDLATARQTQRAADDQAAAEFIQSQQAAASAALASVADRTRAIEDEMRAVALSADGHITLAYAVEQVAIARLKEKQAGFYENSEGWENLQREIDQRTKLLALMGQRDDQAKVVEQAKEARDEWTKFTDSVYPGLTDSLFRAFEAGKGFFSSFWAGLKNTLKTSALKFAIQATIGISAQSLGISGANAATLGGNSGGAASALSWLTDFGGNADTAIYKLGGSLFKAGLEDLGGTLLDNSAVIGKGLETLGEGLGYLNALLALKDGKFGQAAGAAIGTYFGGPIGSAIGSTIGKYIDKAFGGETRVGGQFAVAYDDQVVNNRRGQTYAYEGQQYDRDFSGGARNRLVNGQAYRLEGDPVSGGQDDAIKKAIAGTATGIGDMLKALGSKVTLSGFWAGLETSEKGRGGVFAGGSLSDGTAFGESGKGDNYVGTLYEKFSSNSPDFKTALENFTLDLKQSAIQALQSVGDIPESVKRKLAGVDAEALTSDAADALLTAINAQIVGVTQFKSALEAMGMDKFAGMSFDAASAIGELSGGFDKLQANLGSYYENFYSEEERKAALTKQIGTKLKDLGLELPDLDADDARARFRALIDAQDPATESGQRMIAMLLALSPAVASVTKAGTDGAASAQVLNARRQQEIQIMELQGDAAGSLAARREAELAAMDPLLREKQRYIYSLQDEATAAAAATARATASRDQDIQILELQGDAAGALAARRADELAAMDPLLREKQRYIYSLQDEAAATAAAAAAKAEADARAKEIGDTQFDYEQRLLRAQGRDREALDRDRAKEYARLMALNPALAVLANNLWLSEDAATAAAAAAEAEAKAKAERDKAIDDAYAAVQRAVDARKSVLGEMQSVQQAAVTGLGAIAKTLKSSIGSLLGEVTSVTAVTAANGMAYIRRALFSGVSSDEDLQAAIAGVRANMGEDRYATREEFDRDRLVLAGQLSELEEVNGVQLTTAEKQLKTTQDELKRLDEMLRESKNLVDTMKGVDTSVLSVAEAIDRLHKALVPAKPAGATTGAAGSNTGGAVVGAGPGGGSAGGGSALGRQADGTYVFSDGYVNRVIAGAAAANLSGLDAVFAEYAGSGDVAGYYAAAKAAGYSLRDVAAHDGYFYGDVLAAAAGAGVPAFATGGMHAGGLRIVGERGWELEASGQSRIWNQQQLAAAFGGGGAAANDAIVVELAALREEVRQMKEAAKTTATNTGATAKTLSNASGGQDSFAFRAAA